MKSQAGATAASSAGEAAADAELIVLAVPFAAAREVATELAGIVDGKVVVDPSNPLKPTVDGLVTEAGPSAAELIQGWLPQARVVKAFNTLFATRQADPNLDGTAVDALIAGDDAQAVARVADVARSIGLRPIDAGPLRFARELETMAFLHISLQIRHGLDWGSAWKLLGVPDSARLEREPLAAAA